jgi:manganese/zinc/iron transport system ATP- binding protein
VSGPGAIPALEVQRLTVSYGRQPALWDLDAAFPARALSAVVGPNGSGKSTLLKAALGIVAADSGTSSIFGHPARTAMDRVAYVPQREEVDWDFPITVREVVEMGRYRDVGWIRRLRRADKERVDEALRRVGMEGYASRQIGQLSGGQRQRAFVARALAQEAELLALDEPFAGIDARTEAALLDLFVELRNAGRSIIVVHHDLATVRAHFDWAVVLNVRQIAQGPVTQALSPENLSRAYGAVPLQARRDQVKDAAWDR